MGPSFSQSSDPNRPRLISNSVKYRDNGIKAGTGRSGSAAITAEASVVGGSAVLTVTSFRETDTQFHNPTGDIVKLQVKAYGPTGKLLFTDNRNGLAPASSQRQFTYPGIAPGARFVVQANVTGIDPRRTDVVTASQTFVARPPDLAVIAIHSAPTWPVNVPANIAADVRELNGDLGARANCVLYVDGAQVDIARGIWVDAGGTVSCEFQYSFAAVKTYELRVAVTNAHPADPNPSNNERLGGIDINDQTGTGQPPPPVLNFTADVGDVMIDDYDSTHTKTWASWDPLAPPPTSFTDPVPAPTGDQTWAALKRGRTQDSRFKGIYYGPAVFPLDLLVVRQGFREVGSTGPMTVEMHSFTGTSLEATRSGSVPCFQGGDGLGTTFTLCYYSGTNTTVTVLEYVRTTTDVSYHSYRFDYTLSGEGSCATNPPAEVESDAVADELGLDCYVVNARQTVGTLPTWFGELVFDVVLETGGVRYSASPAIPLATVNQTDQLIDALGPFTVVTSPGGWGLPPTTIASWTYVKSHFTKTGLVGSAAGIGVSVLLP